jgi:riboflavin kinase/FMN adenylyltransferase
MRVFRALEDVSADLGKTVLSVGNFDGVHRAHQAVLREVVRSARKSQAFSMAVTFEPHPTRILRPEASPKLLTPLPEKLRLLQATGIDATLVLPFNRDLSLTRPKVFAQHILVEKLRAIEVHEGATFHFGHKAEGNIEKLREFGQELGFGVHIYPEMKIRGQAVSSSNIRKLLQRGDVSCARHLLGRAFTIVAPPGLGRGFGHRFTVPTVNLACHDEMVPANGVYITRTTLAGHTFDSVTNVGNRPTFGEDSFAIESHLLNFREIEITADTQVETQFLKRLRAEVKWPDVDALRAQIAKDVHRARRFFHLEERLAGQARA